MTGSLEILLAFYEECRGWPTPTAGGHDMNSLVTCRMGI